MEMSAEGPQLSYGRFGQLGQESYYWQLPEVYLGDKVSPEWQGARADPPATHVGKRGKVDACC